MTNTRAGRPTDEAQPRSTCPWCGGEKAIDGRSTRPADSGRWLWIVCPRCDGKGTVQGTVPAGDLAQWAAEGFLHAADIAAELDKLRNHLAAMPQPDVNTALLGALLAYHRCWVEPPPRPGEMAEYAIDIEALRRAYQGAEEAIAQAEKGAAG